MKLLRYGPAGQEKPGLLDNNGFIRDISSVVQDLTKNFLSPTYFNVLAQMAPEKFPIVRNNPRIGPCVGNVGNFLCIGLNYKDHALETGAKAPIEPVLFTKLTSAISGPYDDIIIPRNSKKTDWEVELGVVIGTPAKYITEKNALKHVAGYCIVNDLSERAFQLEGTGQWVKGKSCDTFAPIGPWLVTPDEIPDVQELELCLKVDGHPYQNGNTKDMIFSVSFLISYLSQFFTLQPGDIITTGTPAGVGLGQKPYPIYLQPGQHIQASIRGLGEQSQKTITEK